MLHSPLAGDEERKQPFQRMSDIPSLPPAHDSYQQQHHPPNLTIPPSLSTSPASHIPLSPDAELASPQFPPGVLSPSQVDDPDAPVIPLVLTGSGAHDECSATCILSHPTRSALIFVVVMFSIVTVTTLLLIIVKAVRGDAPVASSTAASSSSSDITTAPLGDDLLPILPESNVTIVLPLVSAAYKTTAISASTLLHSLEDQLAHNSRLHMTLEVLSSVTPKVPDDGDMVSALIMLMWGLSPLVSAISTIAWTYYTFRGKRDFEPSHEAGHSGDTYHHHHHPKLVNTNPPLSSDEPGQKFALYPPSASSGSPGGRNSPASRGSSQGAGGVATGELERRDSVQERDPTESVALPIAAVASRAATAFVPSSHSHSQSQLTRRNVSPPPSANNPSSSTSTATSIPPPQLHSPQPLPALRRAVSAPVASADHLASAHVSRQRCARVHAIHPFYSRRAPIRPRFFWFIPMSKAELFALYKPTRRFLIRCYFLPILIPTIAAIIQYVSGGLFGINGWLSSEFVPTLTSAINLPQTVAGEVWACILAFWYELLFGCWWDPFPPGSADWGRGMNFHGASWMALSAMEEIGWAGVLFPCLYELFPHNPTKASLICGLIWSAWHWPFLLFGQLGWLPDSAAYHSGLLSTPWLYGFVMFTLSTTFSRVIMVRLLMWSDDLWSQCVYHAAHNVMVFNFFAQLPETSESLFPYAGLWIAEAGVPVVVIYMAVAGWTIKGWYDDDARRVAEERLQATKSMPPRVNSGGAEETGIQRQSSGGEEARRDWPLMSPIEEEKTRDNGDLLSPEQERASNGKKVRFSKETVDMKEPLMQGIS